MRQLIFIAIGFSAILVLHLLGISGWYYSIRFYDKFVHFLAGFFGSTLIFFLLFRLTDRGLIMVPKTFYSVFVFTAMITIGVGWEFFEIIFLPQFQLGVSDTIFDIFAAGVGSLSANLMFYENFRNRYFMR